MDDLTGRVAVVTGGGSGIGRGIALHLGAEGMTVAVADIQQATAEAVAEEIGSAGGRAFGIGLDVTSCDALAAAAKEIVARAGRVNLLCANAGVLARVAPLGEHSVEDWEYTLSVNVMGIVKTVDAFLPALRESAPEAHIVNTASLGGLVSDVQAPIAAYVASKYACVGFSEMLRAELASEGIGVSVLCPGMVASNLTATSAANRPEAFGGRAAPQPAAGGGAELAPPPEWFMPAEDVGPIVTRAVRANRLYVITHPQLKPLVEARSRAILDDFDFAAGG
jgi:NAD(P)-dependent dehydrogenase (short-subunit alcohol dehydrogenase family)